MRFPLTGVPDALAVHDGRRGAGLATFPIANLLVEGKVQAVEHTIAVPAHEPAVHRAARWQVPGQGSPLATGAQQIQHRIEDLAQALRGGLSLGGLNEERPHQVPFGIGQVTRVAQTRSVVVASVRGSPHRRLYKSAPASESQPTTKTQISLGRALSR